MLLVLDFSFDDENRAEVARHGITPRQLLQILANSPRVNRNRKRRRAFYMLVGRDDGGACIAVPIERTHDPVVRRPVTAWYCKPAEWGLAPG